MNENSKFIEFGESVFWVQALIFVMKIGEKLTVCKNTAKTIKKLTIIRPFFGKTSDSGFPYSGDKSL